MWQLPLCSCKSGYRPYNSLKPNTYHRLSNEDYTMLELKKLERGAISAALEKAHKYRLLNEPEDAESICLDILATEPEHQEALITLLLALTDKFAHSGLNPSFQQARELLSRIESTTCKAYYLGIIYERRAKYHLRQGGPGGGTAAHGCFERAMQAYEEALTDCDPKNQDAVLRWNSCARILNSNPDVKADDTIGADLLLDPFEVPH